MIGSPSSHNEPTCICKYVYVAQWAKCKDLYVDERSHKLPLFSGCSLVLYEFFFWADLKPFSSVLVHLPHPLYYPLYVHL